MYESLTSSEQGETEESVKREDDHVLVAPRRRTPFDVFSPPTAMVDVTGCLLSVAHCAKKNSHDYVIAFAAFVPGLRALTISEQLETRRVKLSKDLPDISDFIKLFL